jgi:hypothetical protein
MLVECLVLRNGPTFVDVRQHHLQFMPIPGSNKGEQTTSVSDVADDEDLKYLIGDPIKGTKGRPNFRPYDQDVAYSDLLKRRKEREEKTGRFSGFSIEKLTVGGLDRGYMLVDFRSTSPKFAGVDLQWTQDYQKVMPFNNQSAASEALGAMVSVGKEGNEKRYPCQMSGCDKGFDSPIDLSEHIKKDHGTKQVESPAKVVQKG